ncbi:MAG TPA: SDR family oxidoreductase [Acidimicrobiales bacterium]|nr:SDR family oxidoreductase [Acidimicrobiales bacterium]
MDRQSWKAPLLQGRVVVVAGVGPGLGAHVARDAAAAGAAVMLGSRNAAYLDELSAELRDAGAVVARRTCDVTSDPDCRALFSDAVDELGGVDGVVCNAYAQSRAYGRTLEESDVDDWKEAFDVNVFGSLRVVKAAIPALKARAAGSVVLVGSQIVRRVFAGRGPYAASKAALVTAGHVLARELGPFGIRVNTIVPGRMRGPALERHLTNLAAERGTSFEAELARMESDVPLPQLTTDEECARVVVFLLSDLAAGMTGQSVDVNAGETMR